MKPDDPAPVPPPPASDRDYQHAMLTYVAQLVASSKTTQQQQQRVLNIGEYTQSLVAILVVITACWGVSTHTVEDVRMPPEFWTIVGLVVGFYFGRNPLRPLPQTSRTPDVRTRDTDLKVPAPPAF